MPDEPQDSPPRSSTSSVPHQGRADPAEDAVGLCAAFTRQSSGLLTRSTGATGAVSWRSSGARSGRRWRPEPVRAPRWRRRQGAQRPSGHRAGRWDAAARPGARRGAAGGQVQPSRRGGAARRARAGRPAAAGDELVDAPSLHELVEREGLLPTGLVARLGLGLLDTLDAAHRQGVVHLDVTLANVLVLAGGGRPVGAGRDLVLRGGRSAPVRPRRAAGDVGGGRGRPTASAAAGRTAGSGPARRAAKRPALRPDTARLRQQLGPLADGDATGQGGAGSRRRHAAAARRASGHHQAAPGPGPLARCAPCAPGSSWPLPCCCSVWPPRWATAPGRGRVRTPRPGRRAAPPRPVPSPRRPRQAAWTRHKLIVLLGLITDQAEPPTLWFCTNTPARAAATAAAAARSAASAVRGSSMTNSR